MASVPNGLANPTRGLLIGAFCALVATSGACVSSLDLTFAFGA
jgi:hypothetical protein